MVATFFLQWTAAFKLFCSTFVSDFLLGKQKKNSSRNTTKNKCIRGTQRQFLENICSEGDLRSRIFGTFVVKFLSCLPLLGFSNI